MRAPLAGIVAISIVGCSAHQATDTIQVATPSQERCVKYEVYEDVATKWRWRKKAGGQITATAGQSYSYKYDAMRAAKKDSTSTCDEFSYVD